MWRRLSGLSHLRRVQSSWQATPTAALTSEAGSDPKVEALVYIAAFAPDAGESAGSLGTSVEPAPLGAEVRPDAQGYLKL